MNTSIRWLFISFISNEINNIDVILNELLYKMCKIKDLFIYNKNYDFRLLIEIDKWNNINKKNICKII